VATDLRRIYQAATADQAAAELDAFAEKRAGKYASVAPAWRRAWQKVIPFFAFDPAIRKIICTTNAIKSLTRCNPQIHQDARLIPDRGGRDQADLPGHPQLRERRQECPGVVCRAQSIRHHVRRPLQRATVTETRMDRTSYTEFMTLPSNDPMFEG